MVKLNCWEKFYRQRRFFIKYPDENLIRFMAKFFYFCDRKKRKNLKILDLGCGVGRNSIFLAQEKFTTYGLDIAETGLRLGLKKAKTLKLKNIFFVRGCLQRLPFYDYSFDAVVDIQAIQQNRVCEIEEALAQITRVIRPGGYLFSMAVSTDDYFCGKFRTVEKNTYYIPHKHTFKGITHFFNYREIRQLYSRLNIISIEKIIWTYENRSKKSAYWLITCRKD